MMARVILLTAIAANVGVALGAGAHMLAADDLTFVALVVMLLAMAGAFICGCALEDFDDRAARRALQLNEAAHDFSDQIPHGDWPVVPTILSFHERGSR
jgi:hypothetical protein